MKWPWTLWKEATQRREYYCGLREYVARMHRQLNPTLPGTRRAVRGMQWAEESADTPRQRRFAWCPWCDLEMISAKCRWWYNSRECLIYLQCSRCKRRSRWDFDSGNLVQPCVDARPLHEREV